MEIGVIKMFLGEGPLYDIYATFGRAASDLCPCVGWYRYLCIPDKRALCEGAAGLFDNRPRRLCKRAFQPLFGCAWHDYSDHYSWSCLGSCYGRAGIRFLASLA